MPEIDYTYEKALYGFHPIAGVLAKPLFRALANKPTERKLVNATVTRACNDRIVRSMGKSYIDVRKCVIYSQGIRGLEHPMTRRNLLRRLAAEPRANDGPDSGHSRS